MSVGSAYLSRLKMAWWTSHTPAITQKLVPYARYDGHWSSIPRKRSSNDSSGTESSRTRSVIAIAKTPSLKASALSVSKRLSTSWAISARAYVFLRPPEPSFRPGVKQDGEPTAGG